ncbi:MAG: outer membrane protein assembly factor [Bacteroidales bacterium]|nr:outer membrane protein assembly factor [Bacteroidales bacterium]
MLYKSKLYRLTLLVIFISLVVSSCSPVKYVSDDEYLLDRYRIKVKEGKIKTEELKSYVRQKPNKRILGIRFHLWLYNLSAKNNNKEKGLNNWLRTIGEKPVIYDSYLMKKSTGHLKTYFDNKGYYNSIVDDTIQFRRKRVRVLYKVYINEPFKIRNVRYQCNDTCLIPKILPDTINSYIKPGENFDLDLLESERKRVESEMKNKGYYNFNKEFIHFQADSSAKTRDVELKMIINEFQEKGPDNTVITTNHKKYIINKVSFFTNFDQKEALEQREDYYKDLDTIYLEGVYFITRGDDKLNTRVILQSNFIQEGETYSLFNTNKTYKHLNSLRLFKIINIQFNEVDSLVNDSLNIGYINCNIQLTKYLLQSYTIELQGTNSYGNIGVGGNFLYQHRSLFGGAEITDFRINGAIEALDTSLIEFSRINNAIELGGNITVSIPKFMLPVFKAEKFSKKYSPKTQISVGYNYQDRLEYKRSVANMSYGYIWDGNRYLKHSFKLLELNAVNLPYATTDFKNYIDSTYLKSSYDNHLVSVINYNLIFNNQDIRKNADFYFFRLNAEISGNILSGISELTNASKNEEGKYLTFGIPFSQYAKSDLDFRYYNIINKSNSVILRLFGGIGIPYGNSSSLPFEKMYFSGGANSIRAWSVRNVGPGSYSGGSKTRFPNQTGDIKLEANLEYRFKMFWLIEGALFIDAGNVWNLNSDEFEGGLFRKNEFYKEFAIGSGVGTRFDFSFFIFRLDMGIKLRDPAFPENERWVFGNRSLNWQDDFTINIGIGYPF